MPRGSSDTRQQRAGRRRRAAPSAPGSRRAANSPGPPQVSVPRTASQPRRDAEVRATPTRPTTRPVTSAATQPGRLGRARRGASLGAATGLGGARLVVRPRARGAGSSWTRSCSAPSRRGRRWSARHRAAGAASGSGSTVGSGAGSPGDAACDRSREGSATAARAWPSRRPGVSDSSGPGVSPMSRSVPERCRSPAEASPGHRVTRR